MSKQFPIPDESTRKQFVEASVLGSLFGQNKYNNRNISLPKIDFKDDFKEIFNNEFNDNVIEAAFQQDGNGIINKSPLERAVYLTRKAENDYNNTIFKYPYLHYPSKDGIKPLNISDDIPLRQQLRDHINPYLRTNGMEAIPLDSDYDTASKMVDDRIKQRSRFLRGVMDYNGNMRVEDEHQQLLDDNVKSKYGDNSVKSRLEYAATHIPPVMTKGGRVGLYEYGAIPRYQMDGFGEHDLFLNNGKKSAKSKIASEGYLLGKRGEKVVDVEDVQYIHKGVSRKDIQQRNNGNIDRQDQTENLSMKNLRNVILPVLGLGALKKKNKK